MNFKKDTTVNYDPLHVISQRRQLNKNKAFEHRVVEGLVGKSNWMDYQTQMKDTEALQENTLAIMKSTTIIIPTPSKVEMAGKRTHSEAMETIDK